MEEKDIHDIARHRLEKAYDQVQKMLDEHKEFIEKLFTLQRYYMENDKVSLEAIERNYDSLELTLEASVEELLVGFQCSLQTYLDLSDLKQNKIERLKP